jgi:serine/threonine protein kinase
MLGAHSATMARIVSQGSPVVVVGAGTLGRALTHRINGLSVANGCSVDGSGMRVVGLVDDDPRKVGLEYRSTFSTRAHGDGRALGPLHRSPQPPVHPFSTAAGGTMMGHLPPPPPSLKVMPMRDMERLVSAFGVRTAVLATAADDAQSAAECMVAAGVTRIVNFSLGPLSTPRGVQVMDAWEQTTRLLDLIDGEGEEGDGEGSRGGTPHSSGGGGGGGSTSGVVRLPRSRYERDFETEGPLGSGGFGSVHCARNRLDGRRYAVKRVVLRELTHEELGGSSGGGGGGGARGGGATAGVGGVGKATVAATERHSADLLRTYVLETSEADTYRWMLREVRAMAALQDHPNVVRYHQSWLELGDMPALFSSSSSSSSSSSWGSGGSVSAFSASSTTSGGGGVQDPERADAPAFAGSKALLLCIQMELCEGETLRQLLDQRDRAAAAAGGGGGGGTSSSQAAAGALPAVLVLHIARQMLAGIAHIHAAGFLHRDIKPDNVFLQYPHEEEGDGSTRGAAVGGGGRGVLPTVKIGDLGLCSELPSRRDAAGQQQQQSDGGGAAAGALGTWAYAAPEQRARAAAAVISVLPAGAGEREAAVNAVATTPAATSDPSAASPEPLLLGCGGPSRCGATSRPTPAASRSSSDDSEEAGAVDAYSVGVVLLEMLHPGFRTGMERCRAIASLRTQRRLPAELLLGRRLGGAGEGWAAAAGPGPGPQWGGGGGGGENVGAVGQQRCSGAEEQEVEAALARMVLRLTDPEPAGRLGVAQAQTELAELAELLQLGSRAGDVGAVEEEEAAAAVREELVAERARSRSAEAEVAQLRRMLVAAEAALRATARAAQQGGGGGGGVLQQYQGC